MADTAVAITAGTGTNIDTRTEGTNGNHRQVVVIGDPATNAGVAPVDATNGVSVTLTTAIPAGSAAIGKLAANSGVDIGDVDVTTVPADPFGVNADAASATGSISAKLRYMAATGVKLSDGTNAAAIKAASTAAAASDPALVVAISPNGEVAHDAADSGNGAKIAAKAVAGMSGVTLVAAADRTDLYAGLDGAQYVRPHAGLEDLVSGVATCTSGANTSILSAAGAGIKIYVMGGMIVNGGSSNGNCIITDGSGGTTKLNVPFPASTGTVFTLPVPVGFTANTAVFADPSGSDNITVTLYGFKSKV